MTEGKFSDPEAMADVAIVSVQLQSEPVSGVPLEAYVKCEKNGRHVQLACVDGSCDGSATDSGHGDGPGLQFRWFRSSECVESTAWCHFHPERKATLYCGFWKSELIAYGYMFDQACHCSVECFLAQFHVQLRYWEQAQAAKQRSGKGISEGHIAAKGGVAQVTREGAWTVVGSGKTYTPTFLDVGHKLQFRVTVVDQASALDLQGTCRSIITAPVQPVPAPTLRKMIPLEDHTASHLQCGRFTVLTYNILADLYATQRAFPASEPHTLLWQYRRQLILRELASYDADIICLQEVQSTNFYEDLCPELDKLGFDAVFKKKTQEDVLMKEGKYTMDGCATFYRRDRFSLVKKYEVEFNKAAHSYVENITSQPDRRKNEQRLMKPNVALILVLEGCEPIPSTSRDTTKNRSLVCVANTHIHANQELSDVKLWQVHTLLKGLEKIANSASIPMVVAGDLNSVPGSAPHTLMLQRFVSGSHADLENDPLNLFSGSSPANKLSHSLDLQSVYAQAFQSGTQSSVLSELRSRLDPTFHEPVCTNITHDFKNTLDYICYSSSELQPTAVLELPCLHDVLGGEMSSGLPNRYCPSDHIALMAEFQFVI